jgi:hypothetical protein
MDVPVEKDSIGTKLLTSMNVTQYNVKRCKTHRVLL